MSRAEIEQEGLHLRFDDRLVAQAKSLAEKIPRVQRDLNTFILFPDARREEAYLSLVEAEEIEPAPDGALSLSVSALGKVESEYQDRLKFYQDKVNRLKKLSELIKEEQGLRRDGKVVRSPIGTTYYVDFDNGNDVANDGTTPTKSNGDGPWATLTKVGSTLNDPDKAVVRRGMTQAVAADLDFTNDGAMVTPIIVEADYDDAWGDFANSAQTYTPVFGSKAVLASGNPDFVVGEWMYESTEAPRDFSYEVRGVQNADSGADDGADNNKLIDTGKFATTVLGTKVLNTTQVTEGYVSELVDNNTVEVTLDGRPSGKGGTIVQFANGDNWSIPDQIVLYLPYKGAISGAGKTLVRMPYNPIWNTAAGDYQWKISADFYWMFQGMHVRGTDPNGVIYFTSGSVTFKDCIVEGNNSTSDKAFYVFDNGGFIFLIKCRTYNGIGLEMKFGTADLFTKARDCIFNTGANGLKCGTWTRAEFIDCEFSNNGQDIKGYNGVDSCDIVKLRNCLLLSATEFTAHTLGYHWFYSEDHNGVVGRNLQTGIFTWAGTPTVPFIQTETTKVRTGGSPVSIKCTSMPSLGTLWPVSKILLFEYAVYAEADVAKTFTVYFSSDDDTDWDADPLATELWIEAEYWGHAIFNHRKKLKSTEVCNNFDADDTVWDALTVTVTPLQTGVLYLRGYYGKTQEGGKTNIFYCDPKVVIS